jgi:hypothetical protein
MCLSEFIDRDTVSYIGIFNPALGTVAPLPFSLVQVSPLPCVNKCTVYPRIQCVRGGGELGFGPKTDKHLPQSPFTCKFFLMSTFCIAICESYLSGLSYITPSFPIPGIFFVKEIFQPYNSGT